MAECTCLQIPEDCESCPKWPFFALFLETSSPRARNSQDSPVSMFHSSGITNADDHA